MINLAFKQASSKERPRNEAQKKSTEFDLTLKITKKSAFGSHTSNACWRPLQTTTGGLQVPRGRRRGHVAKRLEDKLLKPCRDWLRSFLAQKHHRASIKILPNTDHQQLRRALNGCGLTSFFPESSAWEVKVDVVAVILRGSAAKLVFTELKAKSITLRDVGQLLGYCRVCRPAGAFILSPEGPSSDLHRLLITYGRTDILRFGDEYIRVGAWDGARKSPDWSSLIPSGVLATVAPRSPRKLSGGKG